MTIASVLLALLTATSSPAGDSTGPALLDFHAEWCGPCHKTRPAVEQLIRKGYPIKTIDIDQEPKLRQRYHVEQRSHIHRGRWFRTRARSDHRPPARRRAGAILQGGGGQGTAAGQLQCPRRLTRRIARRSRRQRRPAANPTRKSGRNNDDDRHESDARARPSRPLPIPSHGKPSSGSGSSSNRSTGFGSGTIIHSTPEESLILTCGHIFKLEGRKASRSLLSSRARS